MRLLSIAALGVLLALAGSPAVFGQEAAEPPVPGTVVFSQNMCPYENHDKLNELTDSVFGPVLDEMMKEGQLLGWGVLTHLWGDEWNWNTYYVVESHAAFVKFWSAYVEKLDEKHPDWLKQITGLCTAHKDNIYSVHTIR